MSSNQSQLNWCLGRSLWTSNNRRTVAKNYKGIIISAKEPEIKILTLEQEVKTIIVGWYSKPTGQISSLDGTIYIVH